MASSTSSLSGHVCLVTGASRGIGKGIALQLGEAGATVYITGRTLKPPNDKIGGSLEETASEIEARGGKCVPVVCDHSNDDQVKAVFKRIDEEQNGRLDILVNNAYSGCGSLWNDTDGKSFWQLEPSHWDDLNKVGLRSHYISTVYAGRLMVPRKSGLIVNISDLGGQSYMLSVAYGVGKAAMDRMAADCAHELSEHNITMTSLLPGPVRTENFVKGLLADENTPDWIKEAGDAGSSPEFPGKCVVHLALDPDRMKKSGKIFHTPDLAKEYDFVDIDGKMPMKFDQI